MRYSALFAAYSTQRSGGLVHNPLKQDRSRPGRRVRGEVFSCGNPEDITLLAVTPCDSHALAIQLDKEGITLRNLSARFGRFFRWLVLDPALVWAALGLPTIFLMLALQLSVAPELSVRIAGYMVALVGVVLVVKGIRDKQQLFQRPSLALRVNQWIRRLPPIFLPTKRVSGTSHISLGGATMSGSGNLTATLTTASPTIEDRVRVLEQNFRKASERIEVVQNEVRTVADALRLEAGAMRQSHEEAHKELRRRLEDFSVGSVDFELAGVFWVVIGGALTTFPAEIALRLAIII